MIDVELQHRLHTIRIALPTAWNECTYADLQAIILADNTFLSRQNLTLQLLRNRLKPTEQKVLLNLNPETFYENYEFLTDFIFQSCTLTAFPAQALTGTTFTIPLDDFNCITVGEFEECTEQLNIYLSAPSNASVDTKSNPQQKVEALHTLFSYILRPTLPTGRRSHVSDISLQEKTDTLSRIQTLPSDVLPILLLWFIGCSNVLPTYFPLAYGSAEGKESAPDTMAVTKLIHAAAADKETTARHTIRGMLLKEFMFDMELKLQNSDNVI